MYAMEVWQQEGWGTKETGFVPADGWKRMDDQQSPQVRRIWAPRATLQDAARKCLAWTGCLGIPTLRVVDLEDGGRVCWQFSGRDGGRRERAGPDLLPDWHAQLVAEVRAEQAAEARERWIEEVGWHLRWLRGHLRSLEPGEDVEEDLRTMHGRIRGCVWGAAEVVLGDWRKIVDHRQLLLDLEDCYQRDKGDPAIAHPKGGIDPAKLAERLPDFLAERGRLF